MTKTKAYGGTARAAEQGMEPLPLQRRLPAAGQGAKNGGTVLPAARLQDSPRIVAQRREIAAAFGAAALLPAQGVPVQQKAAAVARGSGAVLQCMYAFNKRLCVQYREDLLEELQAELTQIAGAAYERHFPNDEYDTDMYEQYMTHALSEAKDLASVDQFTWQTLTVQEVNDLIKEDYDEIVNAFTGSFR